MESWSKIGEGPGQAGLVSVVIPTFNRGYILRSAIESILGQSYRPIEIIVVDDGSTDDTRNLVASYDPSIVRYFYKDNAGVSAARNDGFVRARGEFIALLDSDDLWVDWKLDAQVAVLRHFPQVGMVFTNISAINEAGVVIPRYLHRFLSAYGHVDIEKISDARIRLRQLCPNLPAAADSWLYIVDLFPQMIFGNLVSTSSTLIRRERLRATGPFDMSLRNTGEDYEFHFRATSHGPVALLDADTVLYRIGAPDQLTSPSLGLDMARNNLTTVLRYLDSHKDRINIDPSALRKRLGESYAWVGRLELLSGNLSGARRSLWRSFRLNPAELSNSKLLVASFLPASLIGRLRSLIRRLRTPGNRV